MLTPKNILQAVGYLIAAILMFGILIQNDLHGFNYRPFDKYYNDILILIILKALLALSLAWMFYGIINGKIFKKD